MWKLFAFIAASVEWSRMKKSEKKFHWKNCENKWRTIKLQYHNWQDFWYCKKKKNRKKSMWAYGEKRSFSECMVSISTRLGWNSAMILVQSSHCSKVRFWLYFSFVSSHYLCSEKFRSIPQLERCQVCKIID